MSLPTISEATIRRNTTSQSFSRAEDYYESGAVIDLSLRGNLLQAEVEGSEAQPYRVDIQFDNNRITTALCTCSYSFEGWCKHVAAALLTAVRQPNAVEARPTLEQLLDHLDHVQTQRLVQELVTEKPELIDAIDRHVTLMIAPAAKKKSANPPRRTSIDPVPFRRQVKNILREGLRALEDGYEEDPIIDELMGVIEKAQAFSEQEDGNSAIVILEAITSTCADEADDLMDYGGDTDTIVTALDAAWTEAILSADLTEEQQTDLASMLEEWQNLLHGEFSMSLEALHQGWDYPPLQRVLVGEITFQGAWEGESPHFADDLALIRLHILDRQGRDQEYLYLAEAEGQTEQYLTKLAELGHISEAIEAAQANITTPNEAFALAKILREQEHLTEALEVAQIGLALPDLRHYELADWTSDLAEGLGETQAALEARVIAFKIKPSFRDYKLAEDLAGKGWNSIKQKLLQALRQYQQWGADQAKVDIFLHEELIDDAIEAVKNVSSYRIELVYRVMDAAIEHRPEWVLETARKQAEDIMTRKKADRYREAIGWLKYMKAAYFQMGQQAEWAAYRTQLDINYGRLRKLMELLKQNGL